MDCMAQHGCPPAARFDGENPRRAPFRARVQIAPMQTSARRHLASALLACLALGACQEPSPPPAATRAPSPAAPAAAPADTDSQRLVAAARAAFAAGRFVAPADDNALAWFAALRESDPAHPGAIEALVDLFPIAVAAAERALDAGDVAEARRIVALLERVEPGSLGARRLRERIDAAASAVDTADTAAVSAAPAAPPAPQSGEMSPPAQSLPPPVLLQTPAADPVPNPPPTPDPAPTLARLPPSPPAGDSTDAAQPTPARVVQRVEPAYPQLARQRRIEGWVELEFTVDIDGAPRDIRVVESSPNAVFDIAATRALQRWRFEPARRGAQPEAARTRTRIQFRLG